MPWACTRGSLPALEEGAPPVAEELHTFEPTARSAGGSRSFSSFCFYFLQFPQCFPQPLNLNPKLHFCTRDGVTFMILLLSSSFFHAHDDLDAGTTRTVKRCSFRTGTSPTTSFCISTGSHCPTTHTTARTWPFPSLCFAIPIRYRCAQSTTLLLADATFKYCASATRSI